jgi:hypothetical protein
MESHYLVIKTHHSLKETNNHLWKPFNPFKPKRYSGTLDFLKPQNEIEIINPQTFN